MPTKAKLTIRCLIGAYLLYTDYMISGVFAEEMTTDAIFRIIAFIVFAIAGEMGLPVKYIGVGEGVDDLMEFNPAEFVEALLK